VRQQVVEGRERRVELRRGRRDRGGGRWGHDGNRTYEPDGVSVVSRGTTTGRAADVRRERALAPGFRQHGGMKRDLGDGYELDDDRSRVDRELVHRYLSEESYWAEGRPRAVTEELIAGAARVVGLYRGGSQLGFARTVSDGHTTSHLADVFVLAEHRGRGLGVELVRFTVDEGPYARTKWLLHTADAHALYRKLGFSEPGATTMERWSTSER
jgi:GNAT superfamily N-acetyltransferase